MPGSPALRDLLSQIRQLRRDIDTLRRRGRVLSESRSFIIGEFDNTTYIPPLRVSVAPHDPLVDRFTPERRVILGFSGTVRTGSCTLDWYLNDVLIADASGHDIDTTPGSGDIWLEEPLEVQDGDRLRPLPVSVSGADSLEATVIFSMVPR